METVEFVGCHNVEQLLDFFLAIEVATLIEHETTPLEARVVLDGYHGQGPSLHVGGLHTCHDGARREELVEGLQGIEEASGARRFDDYALAGHLQVVGFGGQTAVEAQLDGSVGLLAH